jgi:hypothetical protein
MNSSRFATTSYWCLRHNRGQSDDNACAERHWLGLYATAAQA